jgi:ATP-dependent Clp protease protease subunit
MPNLVPIVIEKTTRGERSYDIYSRLLKDRIIFLTGEITESTSDAVIASMLFLESESDKKPIDLYINSPGGIVTAGMAIYDVMQFVKCPVRTYVVGQAASMASFLATAGEKGHRYVMRHSRTMIHQPLGGYSGQATDIEIHAKEILRIKDELITLYHENLSTDVLSKEELASMMERDKFLSAEQAVYYGLADSII